jgi:hypothetical protein
MKEEKIKLNKLKINSRHILCTRSGYLLSAVQETIGLFGISTCLSN